MNLVARLKLPLAPLLISMLFPCWCSSSVPEVGLFGVVLAFACRRSAHVFFLFSFAYLYVLRWIPLSALGAQSIPLALAAWLGLAICGGAFSCVAFRLVDWLRGRGVPCRWALPLVWILTEEASTAITMGSDWLAVGYSVVDSSSFRMLYGVFGVRGVSGILMLLVGIAVDVLFWEVELKRRVRCLAVIAVAFSVMIRLEFVSLQEASPSSVTSNTMNVGVVQLDSTQEVWSSDVQQAAERGMELILGPEGALVERAKVLGIGSDVIVGAYVRCAENDSVRQPCAENIALHFDRTGREVGRYVKQKLVPLYETDLFGLVEGVQGHRMRSGGDVGVFTVGGGSDGSIRVGVLICYEISHPWLWRELLSEREISLVSLPTSDVWDRSGLAMLQHIVVLRALAAEFGVVILRSSRGGQRVVSGSDGGLMTPFDKSVGSVYAYKIDLHGPATFRGRWPYLGWSLTVLGTAFGIFVLVWRSGP